MYARRVAPVMLQNRGKPQLKRTVTQMWLVYGVTFAFGHYYTYASIPIGHQRVSTVPHRIRVPYSLGIKV
jgi:hypothetical protein